MIKILLAALLSISSWNFQLKPGADLLVYNATIYTVDSKFTIAEAMVISGGKILETGKKADLEKKYEIRTRLDAKGKFIYPGFIDSHAHFVGYGNSLQRVNLVGTNSWQEVLEKTRAFADSRKLLPNEWITGRGWDQNDWPGKEYPSKKELDNLFRNNPVLLTRIDGHAAIANQVALDLASIKPGDQLIGGEIEVKNGMLTGILIDNAVDLVSAKIPPSSPEQFKKSLQDAEANCFAKGLTTIVDCGLSTGQVNRIKTLHTNGELKMRLYVMLNDEPASYDYLERSGPIKTDRLHVKSFKVYGDGALGSRGACLLEPYSDRPGHYGFLLSAPSHFDSVAQRIQRQGFQMCTHAIGDSGNRTILKIYAKYLGKKNDLRWRIEHAQVVNQKDFTLFGSFRSTNSCY
jgi:predicted amidohydrolase YtcJ